MVYSKKNYVFSNQLTNLNDNVGYLNENEKKEFK